MIFFFNILYVDHFLSKCVMFRKYFAYPLHRLWDCKSGKNNEWCFNEGDVSVFVERNALYVTLLLNIIRYQKV